MLTSELQHKNPVCVIFVCKVYVSRQLMADIIFSIASWCSLLSSELNAIETNRQTNEYIQTTDFISFAVCAFTFPLSLAHYDYDFVTMLYFDFRFQRSYFIDTAKTQE